MGKKIAFFDIDGTMVHVPNGLMHPTSETVRVLTEFKNQGNYIVVATARGRIPESVRAIDFDGHICSDGHYIDFNGEVLIDNVFSQEELALQIALYEKYHAEYSFGGHHGAWAGNPDGALYGALDMAYGSGGKGPKPQRVDDLATIKANSATPLFHDVASLYACKEELPADWAINLYDTGLLRMDVHLAGFEKGSACAYLVEKLGINPDNAYAFGDGENDIEMLQCIKHGIAMGNASDKVKAIAADVTDTVDNDGIAKAFKKYFGI